MPVTNSPLPAASRGYRRYRPVWSVRPLRWIFAGVLTAGLGQTMMPLALLLLFHQRVGGFALAGIAVAVYGVTFAAAGPVIARMADRHGAVIVLAAGLASAACVALLAVTTSPVMTWAGLVVAGASTPPRCGPWCKSIKTGRWTWGMPAVSGWLSCCLAAWSIQWTGQTSPLVRTD